MNKTGNVRYLTVLLLEAHQEFLVVVALLSLFYISRTSEQSSDLEGAQEGDSFAQNLKQLGEYLSVKHKHKK